MWSQPPTALWVPGEGFFPAGLGMGPKPLPLGKVTTCAPDAKVAARHPRLSQVLGFVGTVPGPPGQCGGSWLALCLLLAHHRLAELCVASPLAFLALQTTTFAFGSGTEHQGAGCCQVI